MLAQRVQNQPREIIRKTSGHPSKPITRLMSPSDLGELVKPFVFLDRFEFAAETQPTSMDHGWHPHSGIATVTVVLEGSVGYAETTGKTGVLTAGSIEWMRAGNGVWHTGAPEPGGAKGFQLWVALPPELENAPSASHYVVPSEVATEGPARVVLGAYGRSQSPIAAPPITYLAVSLKAGERWTYFPPEGHITAWVALYDGSLHSSSRIVGGELAIFEPSQASIDFVAEEETRFVLGSAPSHPHDLVLGNYSVHTNTASLQNAQQEIHRIGDQLRAQGKMSYALRFY